MTKQRLLESYLIRITEEIRTNQAGSVEKTISLHNLATGEKLEFETWVAAWAFLAQETSLNEV